MGNPFFSGSEVTFAKFRPTLYRLYLMNQLFKTIHLRNQAEVLSNNEMFKKIHSGIQAELLTNELNIQNYAVRESGINPN